MTADYDALMKKYLDLCNDHSDLQLKMVEALKKHLKTQEKLKEALQIIDYAAKIFEQLENTSGTEPTGAEIN